MFGSVEFNNFCPFFWLTIFCLIASPFYFTYQGGKWLLFEGSPYIFTALGYLLFPIVKVLEMGLNAMDTNVCIPMQAVALDYIDERRLLALYANSRYAYMGDELKGPLLSDKDALEKMLYYRTPNYSERGTYEKAKKKLMRMDAKFCLWKKSAGDNWREQIAAARQREVDRKTAEYAKEREEEQARYKSKVDAEARRKKIMGNVVIWTQRIAPYFLAVLAMLALWLLCLIIATVPWIKVATGIGKFLLFVVLIIPAIVYWLFTILRDLYNMGPMFNHTEKGLFWALPLAGALIIKLSRKCDLEIPFLPQLRTLGKWIVFVLKIPFITIALLATGLVELVKFITEYVVLFKKDHCPHIKWTN